MVPMGTLYVSDLDGTLLGEDATLSLRSRSILTGLLREGLCFTVATARSVHSLKAVLAGLPMSLPVVEFNGAFVTDLATGRHLSVQALSPDLAREVHACITQAGHSPFLSTFDGAQDRLSHGRVLNAGMEWYLEDRRRHADPRVARVADTEDGLTHQVVCITVIGERGPLETLASALSARFGGRLELHCVPHLYSDWHWLTVNDAGATKDQGIRRLRQCQGLGGHELVVFGDHSNDLTMFRIADRAIAVANATPELKAISHAVIGPHSEDSVALFLQDEWGRR
jgi:Cof subfamily protein (haloacid dehalogenase superfamily)